MAARKKFQLFFWRVCLFEAAIAGLYCCSAVECLGVHRLIEKVSGRRSLLWRLLSSCDRVTSALLCQLCLVRFVQISCSRARLCKSQRAMMLSVRLDGVSITIATNWNKTSKCKKISIQQTHEKCYNWVSEILLSPLILEFFTPAPASRIK